MDSQLQYRNQCTMLKVDQHRHQQHFSMSVELFLLTTTAAITAKIAVIMIIIMEHQHVLHLLAHHHPRSYSNL